MNLAQVAPMSLRTVADPLASPLTWKRIPSVPEAPVTVNGCPVVNDRLLDAPALAIRLQESLTLSDAEWSDLKPPGMQRMRLHMSHHV